jgi:thioredoxin 2
VQIVCPRCASVNRVPPDKPAGKAKCGRCHKPLFEGRSFPVTSARFQTHVDRNDIPVLVDFWADWCGPCHMMAPAFEKAASALEPAVRLLKVDTEAEPQLAARFGIRSIPTLILFKGGKIAAQQAGAMSERALAGWLTENGVAAAG